MLNKGSLCVCVVAVVLVYIGMYAALCKEIGNIIVGVCGTYIYTLIVLYFRRLGLHFNGVSIRCVCMCVCVCVCVLLHGQAK